MYVYLLAKEFAEKNLMHDHPLSFFLSMLGSPASKRQYPQRRQAFFNYQKLEWDTMDQSHAFAKWYKNLDGEYLERQLIMFAGFQKEGFSEMNYLHPPCQTILRQ